ncbi:MAG TPA: Rieske 2Fe-2S domain-containing protein [Longimicrobiales bacterium]|nr:Rieske 2Fe-2S domain-containing protein [Longimicrobiales bacterium]
MADYEPVLRTPDLGPGEVREVQAHGRTLAVTNIGQTYYAVDAICPDDGTNLARDGRLEDVDFVCPVDGARFDARTGRRTSTRDGADLSRYAIRVVENVVLVGPPIAGRRDAAA